MDRTAFLLMTPDWLGMMSEQQTEEWSSRIFFCGHCSDDQSKVYHNIIGQHVHLPAVVLRNSIPDKVLH